MASKKNDYGNDSISSLKGADRVRKRPGVIFGSDGLDGCEPVSYTHLDVYKRQVYDCIFFTMNGELYNSLSPELQAIVDECGQKAAQNQREKERAMDQEILAKWEEAGVTVSELSDEAVQEFKDTSAYIYEDETFVNMMTPELIQAFTAE